MYIDKLDDIVNEYNNTYHTMIKMKPTDGKDNIFINTDKKTNDKDPKFKVGDRARILDMLLINSEVPLTLT